MHRYKIAFLVAALFAISALAACTVHHHHPEQPGQAQAFEGAPGQYPSTRLAPGTPIEPGYADPYSVRQVPADPYASQRRAAVPADRSFRADRNRSARSDCDCNCSERRPAFAPNTIAPAGPVTPGEVVSNNPADWLE